MRKSDFFDEMITAFTAKHTHDEFHYHFAPLSLQVVYYEWNKKDQKWTKLRESDPEPDQSILPIGKFDGQLIEVEL